MKRLLLMSVICLTFIACGNGTARDGKKGLVPEKDCVEVLSFHGKQRCATCLAIEKYTKEVLESEFAEELRNGTVVFRTIDISEKENEKIADKYEVTWSSLFICRWKDGKEKYENMTEFAFGNARKNTDKFKAEVAAKIREMLK